MLAGLRREAEMKGKRHVVEVKETNAWIGNEAQAHISRGRRGGGRESSLRQEADGEELRSAESQRADRHENCRRRITALFVVLFGEGPETVSAAKRWHTPVAA